jgi:hypothetical protein
VWNCAQSDLYQHGCLVPIDMLVVQFSAPEANNGNERNLDIVTRHQVNDRSSPVEFLRILQLLVGVLFFFKSGREKVCPFFITEKCRELR